MKTKIKILISVIYLVFLGVVVLATDNASYNLLQPLPGINGGSPLQSVGGADPFITYIQYIIPFAISLAALLAVVQIVIGGLEYGFSDVPGIKTEAKERINYAIIGLLLALVSYLILREINPDLVKLHFTVPDISQNAPNAIQQQAQAQQGAKLSSAPGGSVLCTTYRSDGSLFGFFTVGGNSSEDANYSECVSKCNTNLDRGITQAVCTRSANTSIVPQSKPTTGIQNIFCVVSSPSRPYPQKPYTKAVQPNRNNTTCQVALPLKNADPQATAECKVE